MKLYSGAMERPGSMISKSVGRPARNARRSNRREGPMKRTPQQLWPVPRSVALVTAAIAVDNASAASRTHRAATGDRAYYNDATDDAGRTYDGGTFAGGVYRPAGGELGYG